MKADREASRLGDGSIRLRDRRLDGNEFAEFRRAVCKEAGHHWLDDGRFELPIKVRVRRCLICDYSEVRRGSAGADARK